MSPKRTRKTTAKNQRPASDAYRDALIRVAQDAAGIWSAAGMGAEEIAEAVIREYRDRLADAEGHAEALESDKDDAESREIEEGERAAAAEESLRTPRDAARAFLLAEDECARGGRTVPLVDAKERALDALARELESG